MSSSQRSAVFASRADLVTTLVVAGLAVVYIVVALVARLAQILPNRDVPVLVSASQEAPFPLGPDGAPVTAAIGEAIVPVSGMPPVVLASVAGTAIVPAVAALTIIACATVLLVNLLRGRFFSRANTALIATISLVIAAGWLVNLILQTMASNGAVATLSERSLDAVSFRLDFTLVLVAMGVGCLGAAFRAGERMQRDTEGLV